MGQRIVLTPYGEVFLHHAKRALGELEECVMKLEKLKHWGYAALKIGAPDSICQYILPQVLKDFGKSYPRCEMNIFTGDTLDILKQVKDGSIDFAFGVKLSTQDLHVQFTPLVEDTLCFITSPEHKWVKEPVEGTKVLSKERLISYAAQSETERLIKRYFNESSQLYNHPMSLGNMEAIKEMTKQNLGVGIVPRWLVHQELERGELVAHEISSDPSALLKREWGVLSLKTKQFSLVEEEMVKLCKDSFREVLGVGLKA